MADSEVHESHRPERSSNPQRSQNITIYVLRGIFFACAVGIGLYVAGKEPTIDPFLAMVIAGALAGVVIIVESLSAQSSIATVSAIVFGLIIGFIAAQLFIGVVSLMGDFETPEGVKAMRYIRLALML